MRIGLQNMHDGLMCGRSNIRLVIQCKDCCSTHDNTWNAT